MVSRVSLSFFLFICVLSLITLSSASFASDSHDRTQFGHDIIVGPGEEATEVTCFGCSVRVRGHVDSDVTTFGGSIVVEDGGEVGSDLTSFGGDLRLEKGSQIDGDIAVFGGRIQRDPDASVAGDVTNFSGSYWLALIFGLPLAILGAFIALVVWVVRQIFRPAVPATA